MSQFSFSPSSGVSPFGHRSLSAVVSAATPISPLSSASPGNENPNSISSLNESVQDFPVFNNQLQKIRPGYYVFRTVPVNCTTCFMPLSHFKNQFDKDRIALLHGLGIEEGTNAADSVDLSPLFDKWRLKICCRLNLRNERCHPVSIVDNERLESEPLQQVINPSTVPLIIGGPTDLKLFEKSSACPTDLNTSPEEEIVAVPLEGNTSSGEKISYIEMSGVRIPRIATRYQRL